jgi:hypothetical protein
MAEPTREELLARITQLEGALASTPYVPQLPTEHDGDAITWRPWEEAPVILCADELNGCATCGHLGPSLLAFGLAGPGSPRIRFNAHRCPACQEMRVYKRTYDKYRIGAELVEISYSPPRTIARIPDKTEEA